MFVRTKVVIKNDICKKKGKKFIQLLPSRNEQLKTTTVILEKQCPVSYIPLESHLLLQ